MSLVLVILLLKIRAVAKSGNGCWPGRVPGEQPRSRSIRKEDGKDGFFRAVQVRSDTRRCSQAWTLDA